MSYIDRGNVETEHLSNIMDKDERRETPEVEKIYEKCAVEVLKKTYYS